MATFLYRVGGFAYRRRLLVIGLWVGLLLAALAGTTLAQPFQKDFSLPGSASQQASDLMDQKFPAQRDIDEMAQAKVVLKALDGATLDRPETVAAVDRLVGELRGLPHVLGQAVVNPLTSPAGAMSVSKDRTIAYLDVNYDQKFVDVSKDQIDALESAMAGARDGGLTVEATGTLYNGQTPQQGPSEAIGFAVALVVMVIAFASVVAATLPIITALFGVGISIALITGATSLVDMDSSALMLSSMLGIAVSIDYSLFIVSRYRNELRVTDDRAHATGRAVGTAGSSVVFAGLTVVIALVGLTVVGIPMISMMGLTAALAVVMAVLAAVTLLPAFLGLFGHRTFAGRIKRLRQGDEPDTAPTNGLRWAKLIAAHPIPAIVAVVLALGVIALPTTKLQLGMDVAATGDQKNAVKLLDQGFGEGLTGPLIVVADGAGSSAAPAGYKALADQIRALPDVQMVTPPQLNPDGTGALISVIPASGPSSPQTQALVDSIRGLEQGITDATGVTFGVTGQTAILSDLSESMTEALVPYLALVVGLAFLVLTLVFRSLLVPLTATLGFVLSIGATFGATVAVFQEGWFGLASDPGPIISFLPIFLIGIVFGLAMDYQVFLVTRMREKFVTGETDRTATEAVITGFQRSARVVTCAAIIMISVFAAFILSPDSVATSMGFALAVAVVFDAFVVRMVFIPAVMSLLGERAWYLPRWLDRLLPDVDVEGDKLRSADDTESREQVPA
ncbi:MMPL family transporter [Mycobacterium sp. CPCC 205372]|uniref:MMPL family transporter n=1 Tax=Mycobacterium hippophais TaxID=3016340 RepID=A0ABT4PY83_9MYCO|nr:MMPL family transporter [Mycobacterium hippophais]MCZ8381441.1 MMPL family transporter [Mycobacterium hippophais]